MATSNISFVQSMQKERVKRSKAGCFTCRYKKKKCDEIKPRCSGCLKSSLECVWPQSGNDSLPRCTSFTPKKNKIEGKHFEFVFNVPIGSKMKKLNTSEFIKSKKFSDQKISNEMTSELNLNLILNQPIGNYNISTYNSFSPDSPSTIMDFMWSTVDTTHFRSDIGNCDHYSREMDKKAGKPNSYTKPATQSPKSLDIGTKTGLLSSIYINGYNTWMPGVELSAENARFYHTFINGFIIAISPQLTYPALAPGAVFVPQGINSPILREIFFVCGASYLSWKLPELRLIVQRKYAECLNRLASIMNSPGFDGTEDWMLVSMLLLCLRDKFYGAIASKPAAHITMAFQIIRKRQFKKLRNYELTNSIQQSPYPIFKEQGFLGDSEENVCNFSAKNSDSSCDEAKRLESNLLACNSQIFHLESENNSFMMQNENFQTIMNLVDPMDLQFSATEKVLVESFLYNYSVLLLICDRNHIGYLPSPFEIFEEYKSILYANIYSCPVPWMNNPVFGAALDAFELAAKASWLCFNSPLDKEARIIAEQLFEEAKIYVPPVLPNEVELKERQDVCHRLRDSTIIAKIVAKATIILLAKIVHCELSPDNEIIQENVSQIISSMQSISPLSSVWSICGWGLLVTGVASTNKSHKEFIKKKCITLSEFLHAKYMSQIVDFLSKAWGDELSPGPGLDLLFDRNALQIMCL